MAQGTSNSSSQQAVWGTERAPRHNSFHQQGEFTTYSRICIHITHTHAPMTAGHNRLPVRKVPVMAGAITVKASG